MAHPESKRQAISTELRMDAEKQWKEVYVQAGGGRGREHGPH